MTGGLRAGDRKAKSAERRTSGTGFDTEKKDPKGTGGKGQS